MSAEPERGPLLHNVTIYVERSLVEPMRTLYLGLFGGETVWDETGHITCVGSSDLAICVHEAEPGHPAGSHELFFWSEDLDRAQTELEAAGTSVQRATTSSGDDELCVVDPAGTQIRLHARH